MEKSPSWRFYRSRVLPLSPLLIFWMLFAQRCISTILSYQETEQNSPLSLRCRSKRTKSRLRMKIKKMRRFWKKPKEKFQIITLLPWKLNHLSLQSKINIKCTKINSNNYYSSNSNYSVASRIIRRLRWPPRSNHLTHPNSRVAPHMIHISLRKIKVWSIPAVMTFKSTTRKNSKSLGE